MIKTEIVDGIGQGFSAEVDNNNALKTSVTLPPLSSIGTPNRIRYFSQTLNSMDVDGSSTPIEFELTSDASGIFDIFIKNIILIVSDGTQNASKYGSITALATGVDLIVEEGGVQTYLIEKAQTGGQLLVQSGLPRPFGNTSNVNVVQGWSSNDDALVVNMDTDALVPGGIRLGRGTKDRIYFVVNDNLTALSDQFITFQGYGLYE